MTSPETEKAIEAVAEVIKNAILTGAPWTKAARAAITAYTQCLREGGEDAVDALAIALLATDDMSEGYERTSINWATNYFNRSKDGKHAGDCTKMPFTCDRCVCDDTRARARGMLSLGYRAMISSVSSIGEG